MSTKHADTRHMFRRPAWKDVLPSRRFTDGRK